MTSLTKYTLQNKNGKDHPAILNINQQICIYLNIQIG